MEREGAAIGDEAVIKITKGLKAGCTLVGHWKTTLFDKDGNIKERDEGYNQVTLLGDAYVADQLSDQGEVAMSHMAVGTTSGGKTEASTTLEAENTRNALSAGPTQGAGASDHQVTYQGIFTGIAATLVEWAVFNAGAAGVMFFYAEGSHVMTAPDTLQIDWTLSVSH